MHEPDFGPFDHHDDFRIDLKKDTCPTREERLSVAIKNYYGSMSDLVAQTKNKTITQPDRCFEQSGACALTIIAHRLISIRDAVTLNHSPIGCSAGEHTTHELFRHIPVSDGRPANFSLHSVSTNITEKEIVYGGGEKLKKALKETDERYHPKAIFILTSCASGIIGDDVEGAVAEVQPEIKAKIAPIHCEGFRSRVLQTGYDAMWHAILKYIVEEPKKKQEDLVNVTNMFSYTGGTRPRSQGCWGNLGCERTSFLSLHPWKSWRSCPRQRSQHLFASLLATIS
jgi:nitrogenase molybdenum-iron protein alpha chain